MDKYTIVGLCELDGEYNLVEFDTEGNFNWSKKTNDSHRNGEFAKEFATIGDALVAGIHQTCEDDYENAIVNLRIFKVGKSMPCLEFDIYNTKSNYNDYT